MTWEVLMHGLMTPYLGGVTFIRPIGRPIVSRVLI